ncbi:sensor histidine kinase [Streptomyces sp. CL12]|uniref:sensor histidine kinase n=1 Tax=Streptomyces sp. CL12 TaxID=3391744 RepID=UPI003A7F63EA
MALFVLVGLVSGPVRATHPGPEGRHLAALILIICTGLGWVGWLIGRRGQRPAVSAISVALLGAGGGAMVALSTFGAVVVGVAALCAATLVDLIAAAALTAVGVACAAIAIAVVGHESSRLLTVGVGALLGLLLGVGRRQRHAWARADAELAVARERSAVEHQRAELLGERHRIAREVHDVLAHTLSALSVQMTALDSLVEDGVPAREVRAAIGRSRRLVVEGLEETHRAVRALRDEPVALDERLSALANGEGAAFRIRGRVRPLPPPVGMAMVRVAQESLTNVRKHAPSGAEVTVELLFGESYIDLTVTNTATDWDGVDPARRCAATRGGYGLHGMRERVELLHGTFSAGPKNGFWRVRAEIPA